MFRFAEPLYLYLLIFLPLLYLIFYYHNKAQRRRMFRFGESSLVRGLIPLLSIKRRWYKFWLIELSMMFMVFGLSQPQFGSKLKDVKREGVEIILAVDVSNSMLAEDFAPNRLERSKNAINQLIEKLDKDRVGMVVFAGDSYVQLPVTSDYISARSFVKGLSTGLVPKQGTSLSKAIDLATRSFSDQSKRSRAIILITDGESHDDDPLAAAQAAKDQGVVIYTVGIGTPQGAPVVVNGQTIKDENGAMVVSKLEEEVLQQLAVLTKGAYVRATDKSVGLDQILNQINQMQKQEFESVVFEQYSDQFYYIVLVGLLLLLVEFLIIDRKNRIFAKISIFNT